jgi:hypothetical protein
MSHTVFLPSPEKIAVAPSLKRLQWPCLLVALLGLALAALGAWQNPDQFWRSYLLAFTFWLEIGLGSLGMVMLHHLVGGRWSALIRRLMETGAMTLPLMALLFIPLLFGLHALYPWTDPAHVAASELLQRKIAYLNVPFFIGRAVLYFVVWVGLAYLLNRWSLAQAQTGDAALAGRLRRLSALGMILYMLTVTFAAFDWLMSLEPEWFSSIYGLMYIIGAALGGLALAILGLHWLSLKLFAHEKQATPWVKSFNDLGNFMLGFVMIWAYFAFSQFLIIWSANLPEEAIWYAHRSQGGWQSVALVLIALHFLLPFFLLLSRQLKRKAQWLTGLAVLILVMRLVDLDWLIMPAFYPDGLHVHWLDLVIVVAMGGAWLALFSWQWSGKPALPQHDPHL